jgi:hypothetical protein
MRKKKAEEEIKKIIEMATARIREEVDREVNVLSLNVERTKNLFLQSLSAEQRELYEEYEIAKANYCNYMIDINRSL